LFEIQSTSLELAVDSPPDPDEVLDGGGTTGAPMWTYLTTPFS
jgi:hypothetical protein